MTPFSILHNFAATFDRVPDAEPVPQTPQPLNPVNQTDED